MGVSAGIGRKGTLSDGAHFFSSSRAFCGMFSLSRSSIRHRRLFVYNSMLQAAKLMWLIFN